MRLRLSSDPPPRPLLSLVAEVFGSPTTSSPKWCKACCTDVGAQDAGTVVDVCVVAAGIADEGRDTGGQGGSAQFETGQQPLCEIEFVVGNGRGGEGEGALAEREPPARSGPVIPQGVPR